MINKILEEFKNNLNDKLDNFEKFINKFNFKKISPSLIKNIKIKDNKNKYIDLFLISSIVIENYNTLIITPNDKKMIQEIYKSIKKNNILNFNVLKFKNYIQLKFSQTTKEDKTKILNFIKNELENLKINIRNIRRNFNIKIEKMFKDKILNKDNKNILKKNIDNLTNKYIKNIDTVFLKKQKIILNNK